MFAQKVVQYFSINGAVTFAEKALLIDGISEEQLTEVTGGIAAVSAMGKATKKGLTMFAMQTAVIAAARQAAAVPDAKKN